MPAALAEPRPAPGAPVETGIPVRRLPGGKWIIAIAAVVVLGAGAAAGALVALGSGGDDGAVQVAAPANEDARPEPTVTAPEPAPTTPPPTTASPTTAPPTTGAPTTTEPPIPEARLSTQGYGPLRIGMTLEEARATGWLTGSQTNCYEEMKGFAREDDWAFVEPSTGASGLIAFQDGKVSALKGQGFTLSDGRTADSISVVDEVLMAEGASVVEDIYDDPVIGYHRRAYAFGDGSQIEASHGIDGIEIGVPFRQRCE